MFRDAVDPSLGRTHAFDGRTGMYAQGLRGAGERSAMLRTNLSALLPQRFGIVPRCGPAGPSLRRRSLHATHPAARRKPVVCRSMANPARRMRRALFCTPRHMTSRAHLEIGVTVAGGSSDNSYMVLSSTCVDGTGVRCQTEVCEAAEP
jgi:hypothetical protein